MRRVEYSHPHYPHQRRRGKVKHEGPDGCVVVNDETGLEERVRHRDIRRDLDGDTHDAVLKSVAHGFLAYATPETLANIATDYQDQYAPGHPAHLDASECDWHYDPAFPLDSLPGTPEEWRAWHALNDRQIGFTENPTPLVVAQGTDGHHYLWDGNHRTGEAHAAFWTHVPAIVGRSRIRDDQPDLESPPGSVERSGLRMSRRPGSPLYLTRRGTRADWAIRLHAVALAREPLAKALPPLGFPTTPAQIPQAPQPGADPVVGEWPQLARPRYAKNQHVQYQRPDMPAPAVGRVISHGDTDGTWVQPVGTDGRHPVRWQHIHGAATVGVSPEERKVGAQVLEKMGVPVDPLEHALLPVRAERPNPHLLARVQALVADGAPIDPAAVKTLGAAALHRVLEHYAGPLPREEAQRPQRDFRAQKPRLNPWADD